MRRLALVLGALAAGAAPIAFAQNVAVSRRGAARADSLPIPTTVAAAEAEGATYLRVAPPARPTSYYSERAVGTSDRRCVAATIGPGGVRSGEMVARFGFPLLQGDTAKVLWAPMHSPYDYQTQLVVRAARVGSASDTLRFRVEQPAYQTVRDKSESAFPSGMRLARAGEWVVVATAGPDWGCFVFTVTGSRSR